MAEDQHTSDRPAHPLPECLTRLLIEPGAPVESVPDPLASDPEPRLFDQVVWWVSAAMFGATAFIFGAVLTAELLP